MEAPWDTATDPPLLGPGTVWSPGTTCVAPAWPGDAVEWPGYLYSVSKDP